MEDTIGSIINNENMNQSFPKEKEKFKKFDYNLKTRKIKINHKYPKVINFVLFEIILILLPKIV